MAIFNKKKTDDTPAKTSAKEKAPAKSMQELYAEKPAAKGSAKSKTKLRAGSQSYRLLVKPVITEKSAALNGLHKYAFVVTTDATKVTVAKAIEELYGVKPLKVNVMNFSGKLKVRGRIKGQRKDWRKAIVTLPAGATLDVYEGV